MWPFKRRPPAVPPFENTQTAYRGANCTHPGPCPGRLTMYRGEWWAGLNVYPHSSKTGEIL